MNPGYAAHLARLGHLATVKAAHKEVTVRYVKNGTPLTLRCRRDQVHRLTERMDAAGVKVIAIETFRHPMQGRDVSQVASYDDGYNGIIWECEL